MAHPTEPTTWQTVLAEQGRTLLWLARKTGKSPRTLYAYSQGTRTPTPAWLAAASVALGVDVTEGRAA